MNPNAYSERVEFWTLDSQDLTADGAVQTWVPELDPDGNPRVLDCMVTEQLTSGYTSPALVNQVLQRRQGSVGVEFRFPYEVAVDYQRTRFLWQRNGTTYVPKRPRWIPGGYMSEITICEALPLNTAQ
jgi:hypothetical protein